MNNPFRRKRPPPPPGTMFPPSWVLLLFQLRDEKTGRWDYRAEWFESSEYAEQYLVAQPRELLESFKGAYQEVPGFLAAIGKRRRIRIEEKGET